MKSHVRLAIVGTALMVLIPASASAFSQATHLYIADHVFADAEDKNDLYYGSIGPDIDFFVNRSEKWPTAYDDTHHQFVDLRPFASNPYQMAYADGWLTHNEEDFWGADHYAHIDPGYVINKASQLAGVPADLGHLAIEVAVDVLLRDNDDPQLGDKLLSAVQHHSFQDRSLLMNVFVSDEQRTDRLTLLLAEINFRQIMMQYARALAKPDPDNKEALAKWGVILARRFYQTNVSSDMLLGVLNDAINLVKGDYKQTVDTVISGIKANTQ